MTTPTDFYVPSEDSMSDILRSAGGAYALDQTKVMSWLNSTSPPSTSSTLTTPLVSMSFDTKTPLTFKERGALTPKTDTRGNIMRPRSRFFQAGQTINQGWLAEDKENAQTMTTCGHDKSAFILEPCNHGICAKCMTACVNSLGLCRCVICGQLVNNIVSTFKPQVVEEKECVPFQDLSKLAKPMNWAVVKMTNIPWDSTTDAVFEFFGKNAKIVSNESYAQPIHMIMDRMSGKTQSTCYVEFETYSDALRMVQRRNNRALGTRNVQLSIVPQEELMQAVFPRFRGEWRGVDPEVTDGIGCFVSREEINSILTHAKTYRSPYSRKCPERPYESLMSIIAKFPWHRGEYYSVLQRDHLFEALKIAIETLRISMRKRPLPTLNNTLLERLVRTGLQTVCFTERQKLSLVHVAGTPQKPYNGLDLMAVGQIGEFPTSLIPIVSEHLPSVDLGMSMSMYASAELDIISRAWTILGGKLCLDPKDN